MTSGCSLLSAENCSNAIASSQRPPSFKAPKAELMPITSPHPNFQKRCVALCQLCVDLITWLTDRLSGCRDEMGKACKTPTAKCQSLSPQRPKILNAFYHRDTCLCTNTCTVQNRKCTLAPPQGPPFLTKEWFRKENQWFCKMLRKVCMQKLATCRSKMTRCTFI